MRNLNDKGMALVTSLMMTLIILVIIIGLWTVMDQSIKANTARSSYRNVTEATYGGVDLITKNLVPRLFDNVSTATIASEYRDLNMSLAASACLRQKLTLSPDKWTACPSSSKDFAPKNSPDIKFNLIDEKKKPSYTVYSKIVDTVPGVPFASGTNGNQLIGSAVAESSAGTTLTLEHYVYTIEVEGQGATGADKKLSVVYEY
ncbi:type IV pilus minor pilin PilX [Geomonas silvestris]|uniref:Type IV pilus minor pilin PilX n=1 Tax=Geomonas silvestris TaxID=2740184 RepID=A0A6V8MDG0_9BACT|nr:hypothetical protein [Geomonas silvestris]GFO58050.1 type IV pilus minor pilin PilX [Geomonas silvestris]